MRPVRSHDWIGLLAGLVALPTLANGFALDDVLIIAGDDRIHHLSSPWRFLSQTYWPPSLGSRLYRPLTSLAFALEWRIGQGEPWIYHAVNLVLYVAVCLVVYRLGSQVVGATGGWWAAAFFAVHPVHVEAVANSVGQAELWAALLVLALVSRYIALRRSGELTAQDLFVIAFLYAVACLFKEHAVMVPLLLVAAELTILRDILLNPAEKRRMRLLAFILVLVGLGFWSLRSQVVAGLVGDRPTPGLYGLDSSARLLTMLGVVPEWARLLFFPAHLQADYLPQEIQRAGSLGMQQLLGATLLLLPLIAGFMLWRRAPTGLFALLWMAVTLFPVSNTLVISGVILAERTLFLPSVGAVLLLGALVRRLNVSGDGVELRRLITAAGVALLAAGAVSSGIRASIWRDNETLFAQTLIDAPLSYRAHYVEARRLADAKDPKGAELEYRRALALFPYDAGLLANAADFFSRRKHCEDAAPLYRRSLEIDSTNHTIRTRFIRCLVLLQRLDEARAVAATSLAHADLDALEDSVRVDSLARAMQGRAEKQTR